jgi:ubiquinone/menaquinone biosynthesis C-methylase UbiE
MDISRRSYEPEILDQEGIPKEDIGQNMKELNLINRYLGGHQATLRGFKKMIQNRKEISVCEIGCGGGDNLIAIHQWCKKNNIKATYIGIDINPDCVSIAQSKWPGLKARFMVADYQSVLFEGDKPDIIFSSLFCHHFTDSQLLFMLRWMKDHSNTGFFINDLHRHVLAYYSILILTKLFSKSYLVKNDAPLSVLRGFKKSEWMHLLKSAGMDSNQIKWMWAFRWLIIVPRNESRND